MSCPRSSRLRVVVWNIAHNPDAWPALDRLEADICLLNEDVAPQGRVAVWSETGTHGRDGKTLFVVFARLVDGLRRWFAEGLVFESRYGRK